MQAPQTFQKRHAGQEFRPSLLLALRDYATQLSKEYKNRLEKGGARATGRLIDSIRAYSGERGVNEFVAGVRVEAYWKYVENGRRAGAKWPPRQPIKQWIQVKKIVPRPYVTPTGRRVTPTIDGLTFLICRKIGIKGIEPRPYLEQSRTMLEGFLKEQLTLVLGQAVSDIQLDFPTVEL